MKNFWVFLEGENLEKMGVILVCKWGNFCVILLYILGKILRDFENIAWFTSGIDASEISRSLSIDSLNPRPFCYKLVKVHLTN